MDRNKKRLVWCVYFYSLLSYTQNVTEFIIENNEDGKKNATYIGIIIIRNMREDMGKNVKRIKEDLIK